MEIRRLNNTDRDVLKKVASGVFDNPIQVGQTDLFLGEPNHHLVVCIDDDIVVGMVSAVHYLHPDKSNPELWINEVGVAPSHRGKGIARSMLASILDIGRRLGCTEAWVLTDRTNMAAMRLYAAAGGKEAPNDQVMFSFSL